MGKTYTKAEVDALIAAAKAEGVREAIEVATKFNLPPDDMMYGSEANAEFDSLIAELQALLPTKQKDEV